MHACPSHHANALARPAAAASAGKHAARHALSARPSRVAGPTRARLDLPPLCRGALHRPGGLLGRCGAACGNPAQALPAAMARCRPQRVSCYDPTARGVAAQALPAAAAHGTAVLAAGDTQVLAAATVGAITDVRNVSTLLGNEAHRLITAFAVPGFATSAVRARPRAECTAHHSVTRAAGRGGLVQSAAADGRSAQQTCLPCDARRGPRSLTSTTLILTRRDTCAPA